MEDTFWITNRFGEKLEALLRKPEGDGPFPAVVFVSGLGMTMHEWNNSFDEISQVLVKEGYATLQFSFSGCGASEGDYKEMSFERQAKQIEDVINYLLTQKNIDKNRLGMIAQSCGFPSVVLSDVSFIKTIVSISGVFSPYKNLKNIFQKRQAFNPTGISRFPRSSGDVTEIGTDFWKMLEAYDEPTLLKNIAQPLLVIYGDRDDKIPLDDVMRGYAMLGSSKNELKIFSGGDHGIVKVPKEMREEFLQDIRHWFLATL